MNPCGPITIPENINPIMWGMCNRSNIIGAKRIMVNTIKNISFNVTDQELLNDTGGIIQGMSG